MDNGKFTFLTPPADTTVGAFAINSPGEVAGTIYRSAGTHAAVYSNGKWTDLGGVTGAATPATGINTVTMVWRMKMERFTKLAKIVNRFGNAWLIRGANGENALVGGTDGDYTEAKEWVSLFAHDIVFSACGS